MGRITAAFGNLKFRNKMVLGTMLVALIPLLLLSGATGTVMVRDVSTHSGQLTLQMVGQTSESLDIYINTIEKLMDLVIDEGSTAPVNDTAQVQSLHRLANSILDAYPEIAGFCIAYEDEQYFGAGMNRISRDRFEDEYWWQYAIDQEGRLGVLGSAVGRNVISNVNDSSDTIFALVKSFSDGGGGLRGVVMFDIRHDIIEQLINRVSIGEEGFLFVTDGRGVVYTPASDIVYRIDQESYQQPGVDTDTVSIRGISYFIANQYSAYSGWRVVGVIPESEFSAGIARAGQVMAVCAAVCLILVILVSISVSASVTRPISRLSSLMAQAEDRDMDVIVVSPVVAEGWDGILQAAQEADIPVLLVDRMVDADEGMYTSFIGADFEEEGRRCARWLINEMSGRQKVHVMEIRGTEGSSPAQNRKIGFESAISETGNCEIVYSSCGDFTKEGGRRAVQEYIASRGWDIDAIFAHNDDMALGAVEVLVEQGLRPGIDVKIMSIDGTADALDSLKNGQINCVVECNPLLGPQLMKAITDLMEGNELPLRIITDESVFTAETPRALFQNRKY